MNKFKAIENFTYDLDPYNLKIVELFNNIEVKSEYQLNRINEIDKKIIKKFNILREKINNCDIKVNTAIFGDKLFLNESYAFEIPLNKDYFMDNENISFNENILTNTSSKTNISNTIKLSISDISSRKNTDFKFVNNILYLEKNEYYDYQEIKINVPKNINSGLMHISFNNYDNISVLNKHGKEIRPKSIIKTIDQVISPDTQSIILRFNDNIKKEIHIIDFYVSENNFNLKSTVITKNININKTLKQIGINTCDNYSEKNSNIEYQIALNNGPFRDIRPLNKQKNLDLDSILSVDDTISYLNPKQFITVNNEKYYTIDDLLSADINIIKCFNTKLGVEIGLTDGREVYIYLEQPLDIIIHQNDIIEVNDFSYKAENNNHTITLKRGFNKLKMNETLWNQTENLLQYDITKVEKNKIKIKYENGATITKVVEFDKTNKNTNSLFLQLIAYTDIYLEEIIEKIYFLNNKLYLTKNNKNLHLFFKYNSNLVSTVKIKIDLKSLSKIHPVFISSLTIRGL